MKFNPLSQMCLAAAVSLPLALHAQEPAPTAAAGIRPYPPRLQWWGEARFGLFVHWGPVSLRGTEIGWSRNPGPNGARGGSIPAAEYDELYTKFNPTNFSATDWVAVAKAAGMKYLVFTSKHHDGFCEFDSKLTDYRITSPRSPFGRDVVKELSDACRQTGLRFGLYYSQPDEHQPDYRKSTHARYVEYLHGQVRELLSNYGRVDIIWFDGLGGSAQDWGAERLFTTIRELQPGILINNRCGLAGDFDTPEQEIGKSQLMRPWESCITICQQWAWKPGDRMKSLEECLDTLVRCAGGDGNLLLNVGPMPDGRIEPRQVERLKEIGAWLARCGDSIYGTRGGPWRPSRAFASTRKGDKIFVHVLRWPGDELVLPKLPRKIRASVLLTGGTVDVQQTDEQLTIKVPKEHRQPVDTIVELTLDSSALEIAPLAAGTGPRHGVKVSASNVFHNQEDYLPEMALDGDASTRWATDEGTRRAWLEVDLGKPETFSRITIDEWAPGGKRIRSFELQSWNGAEWKSFYKGTTIGADWQTTFSPVTARRVRLNILDASEGPTLNEFTLGPR